MSEDLSINMSEVEASDDCSQLFAALGEAQQFIQDAARKDGRNAHQGYDYTTADEMIALCRSALHKVGLTVFRAKWSYTPNDENGPGNVVSRMVVVHPASKALRVFNFSWPAVPGAGRPLDKAIAAALTTSLSYWLRDLLLVPRGDGLSMDSRDDSKYQPEMPRPRPKPAPAAPAPAAPAAEPPPSIEPEDKSPEAVSDYQRLLTLIESEEVPLPAVEKIAAQNKMIQVGQHLSSAPAKALRALLDNWATVKRLALKNA